MAASVWTTARISPATIRFISEEVDMNGRGSGGGGGRSSGSTPSQRIGFVPVVRHRAPPEFFPEGLVVRLARHLDQAEGDRGPADGHPVAGAERAAVLAVHH